MKTTVQAITFDVGGTLIGPWPSVGVIYSRIGRNHGFSCSPDELNARFAAAWRTKTHFTHSRTDWRKLVEASFGGNSVSDTLFDEIYATFATADAWRVYDDVLPALSGLRSQGIRMGVISNWDERLRLLLEALELDSYFDTFSISVEVGVAKPDPGIFQHALRELGVPADRILHVGDMEKEDIAGAKASGFQALRIVRSGDVHIADSIQSLRELIHPASNH